MLCCLFITLFLLQINHDGVMAQTKAHMKINFIQYTNTRNRGANGACCEATALLSAAGCFRNSCDPFFKLTVLQPLAPGGTSIVRLFTSKVWSNEETITFGSTLGNGIANPIILDLPLWNNPDGYILKIEIYDRDVTNHDLIASWRRSYTALNRTRLELSNEQGTRLTIDVAGYCSPYFFNDDCQTFCQPQSSHSCEARSGRKICRLGYHGDNCREVNECLSTPCLNGGTCQNIINDFTCRCRPGFTGKRCRTNINDCQGVSCNNGTCVDGNNNFTCSCNAGFTGKRCQTNINECRRVLCNNGACVDEIDGYRCECNAGFTGQHCDINPCQRNPCFGNATCSNGDDGFVCTCPPGYEGFLCGINSDDCRGVNCGHGVCSDDLNSFTCECEPGYRGRNCEEIIDQCEGHACVNGACVKDTTRTSGYRCECDSGYDGELCTNDVDECRSLPCYNGGTCRDKVNSFTCLCKAGYNGSRCEDGCTSTCIQNQGICTHSEIPSRCLCYAGYTGLNCDIDIDDCAQDPCDDEQCEDLVDSYRCIPDNACMSNLILVDKLAEKFCLNSFEEINECDFLSRPTNETVNETCFALHSFKCGASRFSISLMTNGSKATHKACRWHFDSISCQDMNATATTEGVVYCLAPEEEVKARLEVEDARVKMVEGSNMLAIVREYWYYFVIVGIVLTIVVTISIVYTVYKVRRKRRPKLREGSTNIRRFELPSIPRESQSDHIYDRMTYTNPTFGSLSSPVAANGFCSQEKRDSGCVSSEDCNIYDEPVARYMIPMSEENLYVKDDQITGGKRRTEYYTEPGPLQISINSSRIHDDPLYADPDYSPPPLPLESDGPHQPVRVTLPPPPPLPPALAAQATPINTYSEIVHTCADGAGDLNGGYDEVLESSVHIKQIEWGDRRVKVNPLYSGADDSETCQRLISNANRKKNPLYMTN